MNSFEQYVAFWKAVGDNAGLIFLLIITLIIIILIPYIVIYISYLQPEKSINYLIDGIYWLRYAILVSFIFVISCVGVVIIAYYPIVGIYVFLLGVLIIFLIGMSIIEEIEKEVDGSFCEVCGKKIAKNKRYCSVKCLEEEMKNNKCLNDKCELNRRKFSKYCSDRCYREHKLTEKKGNYVIPKEKEKEKTNNYITCDNCGNDSDIKIIFNEKVFCSIPCRTKYIQRPLCKNCGKKVPLFESFCNNNCYASYKQKLRDKERYMKDTEAPLSCVYCDDTYNCVIELVLHLIKAHLPMDQYHKIREVIDYFRS